jgi:hypothetical protein
MHAEENDICIFRHEAGNYYFDRTSNQSTSMTNGLNTSCIFTLGLIADIKKELHISEK